MCKFPFTHNGKTHNSCVHDPTPAEVDPICKSFFDWSRKVNKLIKRTNVNGATIPVEIKYGKKKSRFCFDANYDQKQNQRGWCGTCYRGVDAEGKPPEGQEGLEGYCNPYQGNFRPSLPTETAKPTTYKNWGMCANWCTTNKTAKG